MTDKYANCYEFSNVSGFMLSSELLKQLNNFGHEKLGNRAGVTIIPKAILFNIGFLYQNIKITAKSRNKCKGFE